MELRIQRFACRKAANCRPPQAFAIAVVALVLLNRHRAKKHGFKGHKPQTKRVKRRTPLKKNHKPQTTNGEV